MGRRPAQYCPLTVFASSSRARAEVLYSQGSPFVTELPLPVPRTVFQTSASAGQQGLKAEYFAKADLSGKPALTRVDPAIQFDWSAAAPAPGIPQAGFCRALDRLHSYLPGPGDYAFAVQQSFCWPCTSEQTLKVLLGWQACIRRLATQPRQGVPGFYRPF